MPTDKLWETSLVVLGGIITGVLGLFTGWLLNKWQRDGERVAAIEDRRREFQAFMAQMRGQANWIYPAGQFSVFFKNVTPNFLHAASFVRRDFAAEKKAGFAKLVESISNYEHGKTEGQNQERILDCIDELYSFLENA